MNQVDIIGIDCSTNLRKLGVAKGVFSNGELSVDDNLDAVLCLLAAADFLNGASYKPSADMKKTVEKESWIWVKKK